MRKIIAVKLSVCKQWKKMKTQGTFNNNNKFMKYLLNNMPRSGQSELLLLH